MVPTWLDDPDRYGKQLCDRVVEGPRPLRQWIEADQATSLYPGLRMDEALLVQINRREEELDARAEVAEGDKRERELDEPHHLRRDQLEMLLPS